MNYTSCTLIRHLGLSDHRSKMVGVLTRHHGFAEFTDIGGWDYGGMTNRMTELAARYVSLVAEVKERVRAARYAALKSVNKELVGLYWDIGRMIVDRQQIQRLGKVGG